MTYQLACTDTPGGMGTIANLEQHSLGNLKFITKHDVAIADAIDRPLPERVHPTKRYLGRPRLIVPTVRSSVDCGEALSLKVIVLDNNRPKTARLHWRWMGQGEWKEIPLSHVARGVHTVTLPPATERSFEYYLTAVTATGTPLIWPPTAPATNQTVVVMPVAAR